MTNLFAEQKVIEMPNFSFATIAAIYPDGISLIFDGETTPSEKHYKYNTSARFSPGDRVKIFKDSGTYVVEYTVGNTQQSGGGVTLTELFSSEEGLGKGNEIEIDLSPYKLVYVEGISAVSTYAYQISGVFPIDGKKHAITFLRALYISSLQPCVRELTISQSGISIGSCYYITGHSTSATTGSINDAYGKITRVCGIK